MKDLFGYKDQAHHPENSSLLTTVYDNGQLAFVRSMLDSENIPYFITARGSGVAVSIIAGFNSSGMEIFVPDSVLELAKALISGDIEMDSEDAKGC